MLMRTSFGYTRYTTSISTSDAPTASAASPGPVFEMSPTRAASACWIGRNRKAIATPVAKTSAVRASIGSLVFISSSQIATTPAITNGNAPSETSKP